jgi:hypothetical protein
MPQQTWSHAVAACLRRCARCARCKHVSVSLGYGDCSWYASAGSCASLQQVPTLARLPGSLVTGAPSCSTKLAPLVVLSLRPYLLCAQVPAGFRSGSMAAWRRGRCARTLEPIVRPRSAAEWLGRSVPGLCGATDDGAAGTHSCDHADAGVWSFTALGVHASQGRVVHWHEAAHACLQRCASCSRCRNISISLRNEECSWCAIYLARTSS